jgi:hypothetical protein
VCALQQHTLTAIPDQTSHTRFFESVALQRFQKISWFGFERKALYEAIFSSSIYSA